MSAEWLAKKKDQLRLLGKHPVPNTKAKAICAAEGVVRSEQKKQLPATPKLKMIDRVRRMLLMCKTDEAAEKFRKKSYGGKKGLGTATQEESKRREEVDVATTTQEENETREEVDDNVATIESGDVCETEVHGGQTNPWMR